MIDWVFIDVGNVLFNDDPQNFHGYRLLYERIRGRHPHYTFDAMLAERESLARQGHDLILSKIAGRYLPDDEIRATMQTIRATLLETYEQNNIVSDGAFEVLEALRRRFRLGIIANQSLECRRCLDRRGLLEFFDVVAISDELDLHKPDPRLFQWAVDQAGCDPSRSVMIGDRRDNDVSPAAGLSLHTVLVRWQDCRGRGWDPVDPQAQAFLDSLNRVPLFSAVPVGPEPDATVPSLRDVPPAVCRLAGASDPPHAKS